MSTPGRSDLVRYGLFGLPLAFAGLPLYVHLPRYYSEVHGMGLTLIGALLLAARLVDTVQDPLIGWAADRWPHRRRTMMMASLPLLALSYAAIFWPLPLHGAALSAWLLGMLVLAYTGFSILSILYSAAGVTLAGGDYHANTRVAAAREGIVLIGVVLAAALLPQLLINRFGMAQGFLLFSGLFAVTLFACAVPLLRMRALFSATPNAGPHGSVRQCFATPERRWLFALFFVNALPVAVTSTLFLFFVEDRLQAPEATGWLLALYFLTAAASVPLWTRLTRRLGKRRALMGALLLAIASFIWAYGLGAGEVTAFAIICAMSGIAVGGDVAILPSLLADALMEAPQIRSLAFGVWNFLTKLTLALAAGLALPLLDAAGYQPGQANGPEALGALSLAYALLPCLLKIASIVMLFLSPLDQRRIP